MSHANQINSEQIPVRASSDCAVWHFETITGDTVCITLDKHSHAWSFTRLYWDDDNDDWKEEPITRAQALGLGWKPCALYE